MYESRDFSSMPILADALEDANRTDGAILTRTAVGRNRTPAAATSQTPASVRPNVRCVRPGGRVPAKHPPGHRLETRLGAGDRRVSGAGRGGASCRDSSRALARLERRNGSEVPACYRRPGFGATGRPGSPEIEAWLSTPGGRPAPRR